MSVPLLVCVELLQGHDVMSRVANRQVVVQWKNMSAERLETRIWTLTEVTQAIGEVQEEVYHIPVWHGRLINYLLVSL